MESGYLELVSAIKTLNQQTLKKWDQTALCEIVTKNNDGTYNIRMLSDEGENGSIIPNVRNGSKYSFKEGDQGVLFKYKNQITMSFLVFKIGGEEDDTIISGGNARDVIVPSVNPCGSSTTPIWIDENGVAQEVETENMSVGSAVLAEEAENATKATTAEKLNAPSSGIGDGSHPIYINGSGYPVVCDEIYANTADYATEAGTATNAQKLILPNGDLINAGSNNQFVYISNGVPVSARQTIGSNGTPVWVNGGTIEPLSGQIGQPGQIPSDGLMSAKPIYLAANGTFVSINANTIHAGVAMGATCYYYQNGTRYSPCTVGTNSEPVFINNGIPEKCTAILTPCGGNGLNTAGVITPAVAIYIDSNGTAQQIGFANTVTNAAVTIVEPTSAGATTYKAATIGNNGSGTAKPVWVNQGVIQEVNVSNMTVGRANKSDYAIIGAKSLITGSGPYTPLSCGTSSVPVFINNGVPEECSFTPGDANYANYAGVADFANTACVATTAEAAADLTSFKANEARFINASSPAWTAMNLTTPYSVVANGVYLVSIKYQRQIGQVYSNFGTTGIFSVYGNTSNPSAIPYTSLVYQIGECKITAYPNRAIAPSYWSDNTITILQAKYKRFTNNTGLN